MISQPVRPRPAEPRSSPVGQPARILVVDDDAMLRKLLRYVLMGEGYAVAAVESAEAALQVLGREPVDLLLLDVGMPGMDGLAFCRLLREQHASLPVLFLSARRLLDDRVAGFDAGGDDFLSKPFEPKELAVRIRALLQRHFRAAAARQDVVVAGGYALLPSELLVRVPDGRQVSLTPTETRLLHCLFLNAGRIVSREQLLRFAWDDARETDHNEIQVYIGRLRRKLEPAALPSCIETARGLGYRFRAAAGQEASRSAAS